MSTRGNVVFANRWYMEEKGITEDDLMNVRPKSWFIKKSYSIYVHSDMYPSGAMQDLQSFLQMPGAKHRRKDTSYLSAWFVGWKCMDMLPYTRRTGDRTLDYENYTNPCLEDMKISQDFFGVGLLKELSDWADYSYLITPNKENENFDIYIYGGCFKKFLAKVNSEDDISVYENEDWWY